MSSIILYFSEIIIKSNDVIRLRAFIFCEKSEHTMKIIALFKIKLREYIFKKLFFFKERRDKNNGIFFRILFFQWKNIVI